MLRKDKIVIWLPYFDSRLSRRLGRKVPKHMAVIRPTLDEILEVCKELNVDCEVDKTKRYPRVWYMTELQGAVYIKSKERKQNLIKKIAMKLSELRSQGTK
ncbi:MAG TPA: signal recognition particle [Acidilobales archaeon]|nr:signal recognition particle [Acidilobales archaeon]